MSDATRQLIRTFLDQLLDFTEANGLNELYLAHPVSDTEDLVVDAIADGPAPEGAEKGS